MFAYLCVLVLAYTSFTYAQNAAGITPLTIVDADFEADPPTCQGNLTDFLGGSLNCAYTFAGSDDTCANQLGSTECFLPVDFNQAYPFNNTGLAAGEFSWANNGNANNAGLTSLGNVTGLETDATAVMSFGEIAGYVLPGGSLDTELLGEVDQRIDYTFTLDYCSVSFIVIVFKLLLSLSLNEKKNEFIDIFVSLKKLEKLTKNLNSFLIFFRQPTLLLLLVLSV